MMKKIVLVLLPVVLLAFVCVLVTGTSADVSAQGQIEYASEVAVEYEALFFQPVGWEPTVTDGCVVYHSFVVDDTTGSVLVVVLPKDLWKRLLPGVEYQPLEFMYLGEEVVTVCGNTVHLLWYPLLLDG